MAFLLAPMRGLVWTRSVERRVAFTRTETFPCYDRWGDQIYNDGVRVDGPLKAWTAIGNPKKRRDYPFDEELRAACDLYYFKHYVEWYNTEPFASANGIIPQVNIWDDHGMLNVPLPLREVNSRRIQTLLMASGHTPITS